MRRIIIVDDQHFVAQNMAKQLMELSEVEVQVARNGQACMQVAESFPPHLILWDLDMGNSEQDILQVQQVLNLFHTEVIYMSSNDDHQILQQARDTRPMNILHKPYSFQQFIISIELALDRMDALHGRKKVQPNDDSLRSKKEA